MIPEAAKRFHCWLIPCISLSYLFALSEEPRSYFRKVSLPLRIGSDSVLYSISRDRTLMKTETALITSNVLDLHSHPYTRTATKKQKTETR